jgi:ectoine hydroxylase-related dioxygenase (phytanoyl-CoA dioxygenase family)/putative sterol carrier protein
MLRTLTETIRKDADLGKLRGSIKIVLKDEGVIFLDRSGVTNDDQEADCTLMVETAVFAEILAGRLEPHNGYYRGELEIVGDDSVSRNLISVFAPSREQQRARVPRFAATDSVDAIVSALRRQGAAIVESVASDELVDRVAAELRPHFDRNGRYDESDFNGFSTLRLGEILARSRSSADLIGHDLVCAVADEILLPHCVAYRIGSCTGIEIWPGETAQHLHRDDGIYPMTFPGVEWQISALWALTDITEENGATRILPGSHNGMARLREIRHSDTVPADMPKGSVLFYLGSTYHGGGANVSNAPRMALINTYALGWLRQEENMYLSIPREVAESYPKKIRDLMGYTHHGRLLGYIGDPSA